MAQVPHCSGLHGESYYPDGHTASLSLLVESNGGGAVADQEVEERQGAFGYIFK
jgi:hypothetical protein